MQNSVGVYPVFDLVFKINTKGRTGIVGDLVAIKDMETFEPSFENGVKEWTPMDTAGWIRRFMTGKGFSLKLNGKRNQGDAGNDYVAGLAYSTGSSCSSEASIVFPNGEQLFFNCVVNVGKAFGGNAEDVSALEFELMSDGQPTYTGSAIAPLTFVCADGVAANNTKIAAVVPVLTGGNSYLYKVNGGAPAYHEDLTGKYWAPYTIGNDIPVVNGNYITLVEVTAALLAVKSGSAAALVV